jgi:hypothetical protein
LLFAFIDYKVNGEQTVAIFLRFYFISYICFFLLFKKYYFSLRKNILYSFSLSTSSVHTCALSMGFGNIAYIIAFFPLFLGWCLDKFDNKYCFFKTQGNTILDKNGTSISIENEPVISVNSINIIKMSWDEVKGIPNIKFLESDDIKDGIKEKFDFKEKKLFVSEPIKILVNSEDGKILSEITYGKNYDENFEKIIKK